jgi:hypothetical protein
MAESKFFHHFFKFKHPTTAAVTGPSQVGKSQYVIKILKNLDFLMKTDPSQIIWSYGVKNEKQMNQISEINPDIEFIEGIPEKNMFCNPVDDTLLILDDLMDEIGKSPAISKLFTMDSHHCNTSVISIQHNLYNKEKFTRTMSLNTHVHINFPNKRDKSQTTRLNSQIFPSHPRFLQSVCEIVAQTPHTPYLLDLHPDTPEALSVISGIFPDEVPVIYAPAA